MNGDLTIVYITDNRLDAMYPSLAEGCRKYLVEAANGTPIISVSQEPIDLGRNICVGSLPRMGISIDEQLIRGLEEVKTRFVAVAEHDCIYSKEHFEFVPEDEESFFYNTNSWLVQYHNPRHPQYDGMYSFFKDRRVQSQLICGTENFLETERRKIAILTDPLWLDGYPRGRIGEPGTADMEKTRKLLRSLQRKNKDRNIKYLWLKIARYIRATNAKVWHSKIPNLDVRHENNFTGQRRGHRRTFELPPWGRFDSVVEGVGSG